MVTYIKKGLNKKAMVHIGDGSNKKGGETVRVEMYAKEGVRPEHDDPPHIHGISQDKKRESKLNINTGKAFPKKGKVPLNINEIKNLEHWHQELKDEVKKQHETQDIKYIKDVKRG